MKVVALGRKDVDKAVKAIFARIPQRSPADEASDIFERLHATPPKQERSVETVNRLLDAAERVLEEDGVDAATVPRIAKKAGVSVGVIYRRFANKDALIRSIYERYLWRANEQSSMMLTMLGAPNVPLEEMLRGVIRGALEAHRRKRRLLLALLQYGAKSDDPGIRRRTAEIKRAGAGALTALILMHQDKIDHPDPEEAIEFCVLALVAVIRAVIVDGEAAPADLEAELTRMLSGYLGLR